MPHARIIAESPERARIVARQLEARGYSVEIVAPGTHTESPADLEITVTADSALPFAEEVFAAPGSILGLSEYEPENRPAPEYYVLDDQPPSAGTTIREALGETRRAFSEGWQTIAGPLAIRWAAYRSARAERREVERQARELRRAEEARTRAEQAEAARLLRVAAEQERERRRVAEAESARMANVRAEQERERRRAEQAEAARLARIAAERERERMRADQAEAARLARIAAEQQSASRRAEQAEAARLAEIAAEKERARQRAIELERQRIARAAAEQEEARRLAEYEKALVARRAEERRRREQLKAADLRRRLATQSVPMPAVPPESLLRERRWRMAFAASACVSALAVLALFFAIGDRKSAAPVSNQTVVESQAVEQQVPFGAATAIPAEAALQKAAAPAPSATDAPKPKPQPRRVFRVDADSAYDEAEPEVIIMRRSRPPRAAEQASRVKKIVDEEDLEEFEDEE